MADLFDQQAAESILGSQLLILHEVSHDCHALRGQNRFWMELYTEDWILSMAESHDFIIVQ
jgi:hypothetical protein